MTGDESKNQTNTSYFGSQWFTGRVYSGGTFISTKEYEGNESGSLQWACHGVKVGNGGTVVRLKTLHGINRESSDGKYDTAIRRCIGISKHHMKYAF